MTAANLNHNQPQFRSRDRHHRVRLFLVEPVRELDAAHGGQLLPRTGPRGHPKQRHVAGRTDDGGDCCSPQRCDRPGSAHGQGSAREAGLLHHRITSGNSYYERKGNKIEKKAHGKE